MQFLKIKHSTRLSELADAVGTRNVEHILVTNDLTRHPNIGKQLVNRCNQIIQDTSTIDWQKRAAILNTMTQDSDVFEAAALLNEDDWKVLATLNTFPGMLRIPEVIHIPDSIAVLGNGQGISNLVYRKAMGQLETPPHAIDPAIFNEYSSHKNYNIIEKYSDSSFTQWFKLPWGEVTLYSSLSSTSIDFPVYPEEMSDGRSATYTPMPPVLYQYEPWQVYESSGPRQCNYSFHMHRDMWTGDHRDGKCNELIRFCQANCYPQFRGSAVNTATVTLYVHGDPLISGIMNDVSVDWGGPLGLDGWYLECNVKLSITEVSKTPLDYFSVKNKPLIG